MLPYASSSHLSPEQAGYHKCPCSLPPTPSFLMKVKTTAASMPSAHTAFLSLPPPPWWCWGDWHIQSRVTFSTAHCQAAGEASQGREQSGQQDGQENKESWRQMDTLCFSELSTKVCSEIKDAVAQLPAHPKAGFGNETGSERSCHKSSRHLPTTGQIQAEGTVSRWLVLPMKYSEILAERNSTEA